MKVIPLETFIYTLTDIRNSLNRNFCFVLGAGASVSSGIPSGNNLAEKWIGEIQEMLPSKDFTRWKKKWKIDETNIAANYGPVYSKRFENDQTSGYEFLVSIMKDAKPTFGHFVLAQILTKCPGSCVLTTNFDSLVESSIYQHTNRTPLICGHESLSGYARPSTTHPLIVKIHRDLLLNPLSKTSDIIKLEKGWKAPLDNIFSSHIPVVIGYGGNDGSLMEYFEEMPQPSNLFWCLYKDEVPAERVKQLVAKRGGSFVRIQGFDEVMKHMLVAFDEIKPVQDELEEISSERIRLVREQLSSIQENDDPSQVESTKLSAYEFAVKIKETTDPDQQQELYEKAISEYSETSWLRNNYALFFTTMEKYDDAESQYKVALSLESEEPIYNANYASLLEEKGNLDEAEKYYKIALNLQPDDSEHNANFASLLEEKGNLDEAEKYYKIALTLDSEDPITNGNYAAFLGKKGNLDEAEKYYKIALKLDSKRPIINANYASFLEKNGSFEDAEKHYIISLTLDSEDPITNGNYASFLEKKENLDEAEKYYKIAIELDNENAVNTNNYALFLMKKGNLDEAEKQYTNALEIDPLNATINGNYAAFLEEQGNLEDAEKHYKIALEIDPQDNEVNHNYAAFLEKLNDNRND